MATCADATHHLTHHPPDRGDLLDNISRRVQVDEALVDPADPVAEGGEAGVQGNGAGWWVAAPRRIELLSRRGEKDHRRGGIWCPFRNHPTDPDRLSADTAILNALITLRY